MTAIRFIALILAFAIPAFSAETGKEIRIFVSPKAKNFFVTYNPAKWTGDKSCPDAAELCLRHRELPTSVVAGAGPEQLPPFRLHEFAVGTATDQMANAKILIDQRKTVNGVDVLALSGEGLMDGEKLTTYGYFFAGKQGYVMFVSFTPTASFAAGEHEITEMLNGLNVVKSPEEP
jgi:hypothetical protein